MAPHERELAWPFRLAAERGLGRGKPRDLEAVVRALAPTVLVGTSGRAGAFTEAILRAMAAHVAHPIVLPMSTPSVKSEAKPADVLRWTDGRALVATGSPFPPASYGLRTVRIAQASNAFVFPGVGLGAIVAEAREVTPGMFLAAADQLAAEVRDDDLAAGALFPRVSRIRDVEAAIAVAVGKRAREDGVGRAVPDEEIPAAVRRAMWEPKHPAVIPAGD
jgi:malate dehydrogenase (oxaloacetate-decarboxylating)